MAQQIKIVTLANLQKYDALIKTYISDADAKSIKAVGIDGTTLKFYKEANPATGAVAAYEIELPQQDLSNFIEKINKATAGDVVIANADGTVADGGVKLSDLGTKTEVSDVLQEAKDYADSKVEGVNLTGIAANAKEIESLKTRTTTAEDKLDTIQGTGEGSITKAVADAKSALQEQITANKEVIDKLDGAVSVEGSVKKQINDAKAALEQKITDSMYDDSDLSAKVTANTEAIETLNGTGAGSVSKAVADAKSEVDAKIGALASLETSTKADLVSAVNEVKGLADNAKTAGAITVETETTTSGMAKSYTVKQNGETVAVIDIPKDMVVSSGEVVVNPAGQEEGTYLVLTLANATNDKVYVNVGKLVDIYKAKANATQIQIAIDPETREISATIVAGSVGTTELADDAIVTAKIKDGNVTKEKLETAVQTSLGKADTALQEADITTLRTDVANVKTSLADGGDTAKAIAAAKKAGDDAQADVDALAERVDTLEGTTYVALTDTEIEALFTE